MELSSQHFTDIMLKIKMYLQYQTIKGSILYNDPMVFYTPQTNIYKTGFKDKILKNECLSLIINCIQYISPGAAKFMWRHTPTS